MKLKSVEIIEKIGNQLKMCDAENRSIVKIFQFHFTDAAGNLVQSYVFDLKVLTIYEGSLADIGPDATVTICDDDFVRIARKEVSFAELLDKKAVQVSGDIDAVHKMMAKFRMGKSQ